MPNRTLPTRLHRGVHSSVATLLALLVAPWAQADILPFTAFTLSPEPAGDVVTGTSILTSYTTSAGTVTDLSHAIAARGNFDIPSGALPDEVRNAWTDTEIDGVAAALNLDVSTGVLNAGDSNDTSTIDVGSTGSLRAQFFYSQDITAGVAGVGNDFFIVEAGGNDVVSIVPLDAAGNEIGDFSLLIDGSWGVLSTSHNLIGDGNVNVTSNFAGVAFDFEDFQGTGTLTSLRGIGIRGATGIDALVVGVNSNLALPVEPVEPVLRVNRTTGEVLLENNSGSDLDIQGYSITSEAGALNIAGWLSIAGNKDFVGDKTVDADDSWTVLSAPGSSTDLSEFEFSGNGGTVADGQSVVLSQGAGAWIPWFDESDLSMEVMLADGLGTLMPISVVYEGNGDQPLVRSDLDHNGIVDEHDWNILQANSLTNLDGLSSIQAYALGDINMDGDNDVFDYGLFSRDFDAFNGPGSFVAMLNQVPEPTTIAMLVLVAGMLLAQRIWRACGRAVCQPATIYHALVLAGSSLLMGLPAGTALAIAPYMADSNTVHLYHFDEAAGATSAANAGSAGNSVIAYDGNPNENPAPTDNMILGAVGFTGFGNAADIYDADKGLGYDGNGDAALQRDTDASDFIPISSFTGADGSFTLELMVNMKDGLDFGVNREFMGMDKLGGGRAITFRLSSANTLRFSSITDFSSPLFYETPVPTTGPHAFATDTWFHVAYTYDGNGTGSFYWTRADSGATSANLLDTVSHGDVTPTLNGPLVLGNEGRDTSSFGLFGLMDEVRISSIARSPYDFIFSDPDSGFVAQVNEVTGEIRLVNSTDDSIAFSAYQLSSDQTGTFSLADWSSLSDQSGVHPLVDPVDGSDPGSTAGDGVGEAWTEVGGSSDANLGEQFILGTTTLASGESISLGNIYNLAASQEFTFEYFDATRGQTFSGLVDFVTPTGLPGDFNGDGTVDAADYTVWRNNLGGSETVLNEGGDGSGTVDLGDYATWKANFGTTASGALRGGPVGAVPEPSAWALLLAAGTLASVARRRGNRR